jgi:hypothetical protein
VYRPAYVEDEVFGGLDRRPHPPQAIRVSDEPRRDNASVPNTSDLVDLSTGRLVEELGRSEPVSKTRDEDIGAFRAWAKERAVPA